MPAVVSRLRTGILELLQSLRRVQPGGFDLELPPCLLPHLDRATESPFNVLQDPRYVSPVQ